MGSYDGDYDRDAIRALRGFRVNVKARAKGRAVDKTTL
jgi:hypothetical protein